MKNYKKGKLGKWLKKVYQYTMEQDGAKELTEDAETAILQERLEEADDEDKG